MGQYCSMCTSTDTHIVQEIPKAVAGYWGCPAYWNGPAYLGESHVGSTSDNLKAFSFNANGSGVLSTAPTSHTTQAFSYPGPTPSSPRMATRAVSSGHWRMAVSDPPAVQILHA